MAGKKDDDAVGSVEPTILRVRSFAPQFCRAGRYFTQAPVDIPMAELSAEDIERIESEPNLKTERV